MAQDWDIKTRCDVCSGCEHEFDDGECYHSALIYGAEGYMRSDLCVPCWEKAPPEAPFSIWQSVFRKPPPPEEEALKKETAESLLRKLMTLENEEHRNVVYILAVMLERKRILVERAVQENKDGARSLVYEHRKTGESFLIPDPGLKLDQLEHVQEEVVVMLGGTPPGRKTEAPCSAEATQGERMTEEDEFDDDDE